MTKDDLAKSMLVVGLSTLTYGCYVLWKAGHQSSSEKEILAYEYIFHMLVGEVMTLGGYWLAGGFEPQVQPQPLLENPWMPVAAIGLNEPEPPCDGPVAG